MQLEFSFVLGPADGRYRPEHELLAGQHPGAVLRYRPASRSRRCSPSLPATPALERRDELEKTVKR